jgi:anaerobic selenocysteine-containing dehydrogenase
MSFPDSVRRAGFTGEGLELGEALFEAILASPSGVTFTVDDYDDSWRRVGTEDGRFHLVIPELLDELATLAEGLPSDAEYPFVLSAGERRSFTANTIFRDPSWRKKDPDGALRVNPLDAQRLGVVDGGKVQVTTRRASLVVVAEVSDVMQPGHVSLPNGLGVDYPDDGGTVAAGVAPNELTAVEDRDWLAGTPWHKHVPARLEPIG